MARSGVERLDHNLGYVRSNMPKRALQGSLGRYAPSPPNPATARSASGRSREAEPPPPSGNTEDLLKELGALGKACDDISSTQTRLDQFSMQMSLMDSAVKSTQKSVLALREDHNSIAKLSGGQTHERMDALTKQVKTLEDSFCDFSARMERRCAEASDTSQRLAAGQEAHLVAEAEAPVHLDVEQLLLDPLLNSKLDQLLNSKLDSLRDEMMRSPSCHESDIAQAASADSTEQTTRLIHQCSIDCAAQVVRAVNGKEEGDLLLLRHPILQMGSTSYMHTVKRGENGTVSTELFAVEDCDGPFVIFQD